jgi:hypothetical protein
MRAGFGGDSLTVSRWLWLIRAAFGEKLKKSWQRKRRPKSPLIGSEKLSVA